MTMKVVKPVRRFFGYTLRISKNGVFVRRVHLHHYAGYHYMRADISASYVINSSTMRLVLYTSVDLRIMKHIPSCVRVLSTVTNHKTVDTLFLNILSS